MAFRFLLYSIGMLLAVASRLSPRLRGQLARDVAVSVGSQDGVARTYEVRGRRISSSSGLSPHATGTLIFDTAAQGFRILLAADAIRQIVSGLAKHEIELRGDATHIVWFYEMVIGYAPWHRPDRTIMPDAYIAPDPNGKVADRITREPVTEMLDPSWHRAIAAREKVMLWQVGEGAPVSGRPVDFKYVTDGPGDRQQDSAAAATPSPEILKEAR